MPDSRPEGQPNPNAPKPSPPAVPSPPLPAGVKPVAPPVPSPPVPKINPPRESTPAHFQLTPEENAAPAAPTPAAPTPTAPTPTARPSTPAAPKPAPGTSPPIANVAAPPPTRRPSTPAASGNAPQNPVAPKPAGAANPNQKAPAPATASQPAAQNQATQTARTPSIPRTPSLPRTPGAAPSASNPIASNPTSAPAATPASTHQAEEYHALSMGGEIRNWLNKAEPVINGIFTVAAIGGGLALAFILYSILVTKIGAPVPLPAAQANNLKLAATLLHWSVVLMAIMGMLIALDTKGLGIALVVGGLALHFGAPWAMFGYVGKTNAVLALTAALRGTGMWLVYLGIFRSAFDLMQWIVELPDRKKQRADVGVGRKAEAAQQRVARDANMFSPCWKLPFCREVIRKQCPAFLAKKTCWKFGRGCYCDEEMISRIIKGESLEVIKAPTRLSKAGKAPCGRCHIYLEHQGFKYKMLSPLAVPITGLIMYFFWPFWTKFFLAFSNAPFWDSFSVDTSKLTPDAVATTEVATTQLADTQVAQVATVLIGVLIGFFVLTYVCKFIEWFVYKLKL